MIQTRGHAEGVKILRNLEGSDDKDYKRVLVSYLAFLFIQIISKN